MKKTIDDEIIKEFISTSTIEISTKIEIIKIYNYFKRIAKTNYIEKEKEIYNKIGVKDKISKIDFEIKRIKQVLENNKEKERNFKERYMLIKNTYYLILNDALSNIKIRTERLDDLLERIILIELDMGMEIGLYEEMEKMLNKTINNSYQQNINFKLDETNNYTKKREGFNNEFNNERKY